MNARALPHILLMISVGWISASSPVQGQDNQDANNDTSVNAEDAPVVIEIQDGPSGIDPATTMPAGLAQRVTVRFDDASLREVVQWLREDQGQAVVLDRSALSDEGISISEPVTDQLDDHPLYLLLNRLRTLGVGWVMQEDVLHITSLSAAESDYLSTRSHSVGDLFDEGYEAERLLPAIERIEPESWENLGGWGTIQLLGDVLFVYQNQRTHRRVAGLLAALREHGRRTLVSDPPQNQAIRNNLDRIVSADFHEIALSDAVANLAEQAEVDARLDRNQLRRYGLRGREPVSLSLEERPFQTVLRLLLAELQLRPVLNDGVLWITHADDAEAELIAAVFDVRDLCRNDQESRALKSAIEQQTSPDSWDVLGGPGGIEFPRPGTMVVSQSESVLDEVAQLLEQYRQALLGSKQRDRDARDAEVLTRYYKMHAAMAQSLHTLLPHLVASDSWAEPGRFGRPGTILMVDSGPEPLSIAGKPAANSAADANLIGEQAVLVIRHTRAVHREIEAVIHRVESGDGPLEIEDAGSMGGGMGGFGGGFF